MITITTETENKGNWVKIFLPENMATNAIAILQSESGDEVKRVQLCEGNNAIDVTQICNKLISVKVETTFETILKQLIINQ